MRMTPALLVIGGLMVFWASVSVAIILPSATFNEKPSDIWEPWSQKVERGNDLYVRNGCSYCHSQFVRTMDWGPESHRIAQAGDYYSYHPIILGTERTGPDLSQDGGLHPDEWHIAHFVNPRYTRPYSVMPSWAFFTSEEIDALTAFVQSRTGKDADERVQEQLKWNRQAMAAYRAGPDENIRWLHGRVAQPWRAMPNPYTAEDDALKRGERIYQLDCINCHGPMGDGNGPAARYIKNPPPLNFTTLRRNLVDGKYIGGILYYQIMNGITGTAMPYFKDELESAKIWDVSNYIATHFIGYSDSAKEPFGIPAAYEAPFLQGSPSTRPAGGDGKGAP